jgi:hypothetical protein
MLRLRYGAAVRLYNAVVQKLQNSNSRYLENEVHELNCKHYPPFLPSP